VLVFLQPAEGQLDKGEEDACVAVNVARCGGEQIALLFLVDDATAELMRTFLGRGPGGLSERQGEVMSSHTQPAASSTERTSLMTVADVAGFFAVSRRQIYLLVEQRELPMVRVGTRIRFVPEEIWAYLERHREAQPHE
jgi:excisionase family DNA binding protein